MEQKSASGNVWDKQPWEDEATFKVFRRWLLMFDGRDIHEAYRLAIGKSINDSGHRVMAPFAMLQQSRGIVEGNIENITWDQRARAFDLDRQRKEVFWWEEQRKRIRRTEFDLAQSLLKKAQEMLDWPIYNDEVVELEDGKTLIKRTPAKWALRDVQGMVKVGSEIARIAAEMSQSLHSVSITLSPEAMKAIEKLEEMGVDYHDLVNSFEGILIGEAKIGVK